MARPEVEAFVLHETRRGAPDSPDELAYRRGFEAEDGAPREPGPVGAAGPQVRLLLAPQDPRDFAARQLGRAPLHLPGAPDRFASLFSFRRMAELLATRGLPPEQLDVFTATQERVPRARYSREHAARGGRWLDHDALLDLVLRARGSLVLNALDAHDPGLSALADQLHAWSGQRVNINAYFTPRAGKTFGWHWDGHDVFIVQVEGRKRWRLFEPAMQHPLADGSAAAFHERRERRTPPTDERTLERGDVLYLPGGTPHDVAALDQDSLHLSIGLSPIRWSELLRASFSAALHDELRRVATRAPVGELTGADAAPTYRALVDRVAGRMHAHALPELLAAAAREHAQDSIAATLRRWSWFLAPPTLTPTTVLRVAAPHARASAGPEFVALTVGERVLVLHAAAAAAIAAWLARGALPIGELAGLAPAEQLRLAAALIERGVAWVEESAP